MSLPEPGPRSRGAAALRCALGALLLLAPQAGCKSDARLVVRLELPVSNPDLNPMEDPRLYQVSLVLIAENGEIRQINTVPFTPGTGELALGDVPIGPAGGLQLIGYSVTGQVLAYGRIGSLEVSDRDERQVLVSLRKPFTYLVGQDEVLAFDTSRTSADDTLLSYSISSGNQITTGVATTPDGRYVVTTAADRTDPEPPVPEPPRLMVHTTAQHGQQIAMNLTHPPDHLSVSPNGRWAVISSTDEDRVTVVDLQHVLAGGDVTSARREIQLAQPARSTFVRGQDGRSLVAVLWDSLPIEADCHAAPQPSTVNLYSLDDTSLVHSAPLQHVAYDITSDGGHQIFLAEPCANRVALLNAHTYTETQFYPITAPTAVTVKDQTLYVGATGEAGTAGDAARIVLRAVDIVDPSRSTRIEVPFLREGISFTQGSTPDRDLVVTILPDEVSVYRISVPPGANRLSVLVYAYYHSEQFTVPALGLTIRPVDIYSYSYVGVDVDSVEIKRRYRSSCQGFVYVSSTDIREFACDRLEESEEPNPPDTRAFIPRGVASIYGVP